MCSYTIVLGVIGGVWIIISADLVDDWQVRKAQGHADGASCLELPDISVNWVSRWRRFYGVSYRTVNLRYKISQTKRLARLKVFWSNIMRVRLLHECLFDVDGWDFVSMDQKPLYFNSLLSSKTLAPRGARKVPVKESVADSRERFTVMTSCPSWTVEQPPGIAVLFRHQSDENSRVARSLQTRPRGLVQWAPKGSYRLLHVLRYLSWAVCEGHAIPERPPSVVAHEAGDDEMQEARARARAREGLRSERRDLVVVLDWFAPHLDERVDETLARAGVACLRIAGGLTCDVQVCDTHRHGPLTSAYRHVENQDSQRQLRQRPTKMPSFSRQHVYDMAVRAWAATLRRVDGRTEWIQVACLNALDGSEDGKIARDLRPVWNDLGMANIRG